MPQFRPKLHLSMYVIRIASLRYVNEERGRPLLWWIAGQAVFFAFSIGVGYLGMQLLPGGFVVNGERPAMDYEPFGDHYLERGGDPHRIPAHVYRHVKYVLLCPLLLFLQLVECVIFLQIRPFLLICGVLLCKLFCCAPLGINCRRVTRSRLSATPSS